MRGSLVGSGLVHLALLVVLLAVRGAPPVIVGPDVVQVALVDEPTSAQMAPPEPVPAPKLETNTIVPVDEEGVKLEKPKKKPPEKPREKEPDPQPPAPAARLPYAPVGNAGLRGQIALDVGDFEFTYYLMLVRNRIAQNWTAPAGLANASDSRAVVYFRIARNGAVRDVRVETSSGVEFFDRSTLRSITLSNPLPPLPVGYNGSELGVHFGFEYGGP